MIIYNGLLISWTFAYESNVFLSWARSYVNFKNQSNCWVCGKLPMSNTSSLPWWVSPLQRSDWMALSKFILEERSHSSVRDTIDITRWDPLTWLINTQLTLTLAINMNFL